MTLAAKRGLSFVSLSLLCLFSASGAGATVFRDRAAFEAAAQNLHTLDFESVGPFDWWRDTIDGLHFGVVGLGARVSTWPGVPSKVLVSVGVPEITYLRIDLPPGTTAVGCDQFARPTEVITSTGEKVLMTQGDGSDFVGFVSDASMAWLVVTLDAPEPVVLQKISIYTRYCGGGTFLDATNCIQNIFCNTTAAGINELAATNANAALPCVRNYSPTGAARPIRRRRTIAG